ncbi:MAG TPA: carboxypeptidase-like regulatory domain-containing protein [Pyrinomonadaceae bacterium]|nr:carboxypeptidase-like regulatory domain-containing protein [Pyrinomonadaceae bacterium]
MRRRLLRSLFATSILCNVVIACSAFAQTSPQEAKETGAITGQVTNADAHPLPGVGLALIPANYSRYSKPVARAVTGADGFYRLSHVPAGSYQLQLLAPGYTPADASEQGGRNEGRAINIAAGETVEHQDFTLARGGVITGRVTDADGKPIVAEAIRLLRAGRDARTDPGYINSFQGFDTDDRGVYRLYGVPAGRYFVSVGIDKESGTVNAVLGLGNRTRTFHPNATEEAQAKVIEVSSGSETTGVDITLAPPAKTYEASGRMLDAESGQPVANLSYGIGLLNSDGRRLGNRGWSNAKTNAAGEFRFENMPPGRYAVFVVMRDADSPNYYSETLPFEITGANLSGLVVKVHRGGILSGVVSIEGTTNRDVLAKLAQAALHIYVSPNDPKSDEVQTGNSSRATVRADGSFRVTGLPPGKAHLTLDSYNSPQGLMLQRVERGGVAQPGGIIEMGAGQQVSDVRVRLVYGTGIVRGQVEVRRDNQPVQLPEGAQLYVTKRRIGTEGTSPDNTSTLVDARGRFILEGLAAGEYELVLSGWVRPAPGAPRGTSLPPSRQTISVPEKGEATVTLVYELSAKPQGATP